MRAIRERGRERKQPCGRGRTERRKEAVSHRRGAQDREKERQRETERQRERERGALRHRKSRGRVFPALSAIASAGDRRSPAREPRADAPAKVSLLGYVRIGSLRVKGTTVPASEPILHPNGRRLLRVPRLGFASSDLRSHFPEFDSTLAETILVFGSASVFDRAIR